MREIMMFGGLGRKSVEDIPAETLPSNWLYQFMIRSVIQSLFKLYSVEKQMNCI